MKFVTFVKWLRASNTFVSQHLCGAGSSPAGSINRDLNSQKLHYLYVYSIVKYIECRCIWVEGTIEIQSELCLFHLNIVCSSIFIHLQIL